MLRAWVIAVAGGTVCAATFVLMPVAALAADIGYSAPRGPIFANECAPDRCAPSPSYWDTPPHLRPRVFLGYEPHRYRGYYEYRHVREWYGDGRAR